MVYVYPILMCKPCSDAQKKKSAQKIADKAGVSVEAVCHARQTKPAAPKEIHRDTPPDSPKMETCINLVKYI